MKSNKITHRAFIVEVTEQEEGAWTYRSMRQDGSLIHTIDEDNEEYFDTEQEAVKAGKEMIDELLDN